MSHRTDAPRVPASDRAVTVAAAIAADRPTREVLDLAARLAAEAVAADVGTLGRVLGDAVEVVGSWSREGSAKAAPPVGSRLALAGTSPPARVVRTGEAVLWKEGGDLDEAGRAEVGGLVDDGSCIAVPLRVQGEVWGHLGAISATAGALDDDAVAATHALADALAPLLRGLEDRDGAFQAERFFELSGDPFAILSGRGTVLRANPALESVLGATTPTVVGSAWAEWVDETDRAAAVHWLAQGPHGVDGDRFDALMRGRDRIVRWSAHADPSGDDMYVIGRDVTREVASERELVDMRQLQGAILGSVAEGVYGVDLDGRCTFANPAVRRILGYRPQELLGKRTHAVLHHTHADGRAYPVEECPMTRAAREGSSARVDDEVFWHKDGSPIPVEYTATPLSLDGEPAGAVISFSDISDRREDEKARRDAAVRESLVQKNAELEDLTRRLAESNSDLEQFAYVASHDLQAPLRAIVSHLELIDDDVLADLDAETREDMRFVADGAERMQTMIDSLLEYSRASRRDVDPRPVDLGLVVDDALRLLAADIDKAGAEIVREGDLPVVLCNEALLVRVVQNLIGNALKYGPRGEVIVTLTGSTAGDVARFTVSDNGPGVPERYRTKVFEMFKRLHATDRGGGVGMGLAICARVVERHGGSIRIDDAPGGGARFTVELPRRTTT